jgi:hypothetical protein
LATRLLRGAVNIVVIALVADFAWHVAKALINRKLTEAQDSTLPDTVEDDAGAGKTQAWILHGILLS